MKQKRNGFLTFCFACLPGAGQMFLGFMRRGISLMVMFFGVVGLASLLRMDILLLAVPVIWFYAFFDAMNKHALSVEEINAIPDRFLWIEEDGVQLLTQRKSRMIVAVALIILGIYSLLQMIWDVLSDALIHLPSWIYEGIFYYSPRVLFSLLIIGVGLYLIGIRKPDQGGDA